MLLEVKRVHKDWIHPKYNGTDDYIPLLDGYNRAVKKWLEGLASWQCRTHPAQKYLTEKNMQDKYPNYWDWYGNPPHREHYMPDWPESEKTHWQMYEIYSVGVPVSPVMESKEQLARWLVDNKITNFYLRATATYEEWLTMIEKAEE